MKGGGPVEYIFELQIITTLVTQVLFEERASVWDPWFRGGFGEKLGPGLSHLPGLLILSRVSNATWVAYAELSSLAKDLKCDRDRICGDRLSSQESQMQQGSHMCS